MSSQTEPPASSRNLIDSTTFLTLSGAGEAKALFAPIDVPTLNDLDFEIEFWAGVADANPNHFDALSILGILYTKRGDYACGLQVDLRLVSLEPCHDVCRYNLACSYSLLGRIDEACGALREAIRLGFEDLAQMESDSDLRRLRRDPRYRELVSQLVRARGLEMRRSAQRSRR